MADLLVAKDAQLAAALHALATAQATIAALQRHISELTKG
jgi:hypothetical protein